VLLQPSVLYKTLNVWNCGVYPQDLWIETCSVYIKTNILLLKVAFLLHYPCYLIYETQREILYSDLCLYLPEVIVLSDNMRVTCGIL
jgi:hypothetical protein